MFHTSEHVRRRSSPSFLVSVLVHVAAVIAVVTLPLFVATPRFRPHLRTATELAFPLRPPVSAPRRKHPVSAPTETIHRPLPSRLPAAPTERVLLIGTPGPRIEPPQAEPPMLLVQSPDVAAPDKQPSLEAVRSATPPAVDAPQVEVGRFAGVTAESKTPDAVAPADAPGSFGTVQPDRRGAHWRTASYERSGFGLASRSVGQFPEDPRFIGTAGANNPFGSATVAGPTTASTGQVHEAGFGQVVAGKHRIEVEQAVEPTSGTTAARVLAKPVPQYTNEARQLRIEGDVRIRDVFRADATVEVLNVIEGLGHGLDENAVRAARQIEFAPAEDNGEPIDFTADIFIRFRLAY